MEKHHIVFRSQQPALAKCALNIVELTPEQHRGTYGVHGKYGYKLDKQLKLKFQNKLEYFLIKEYLSEDEINEVLNISDRELRRLLKPLKKYKDKYYREDVIRACMGGKIIIEEWLYESIYNHSVSFSSYSNSNYNCML